MGVDNGGDGIGRVVEAVDEFKAERDQQRQAEQAVGRVAGDGRSIEIVGDMKDDVDNAGGKRCKERNECPVLLGVLLSLRSRSEGLGKAVAVVAAIRFLRFATNDFRRMRGASQRGIGWKFLIEMGMERSEIAAEGTIKEGLHKTPTTECVPQLFDARRL